MPAELARLPRYTFARALLVEATRTGKARDLTPLIANSCRRCATSDGWMRPNSATEASQLVNRFQPLSTSAPASWKCILTSRQMSLTTSQLTMGGCSLAAEGGKPFEARPVVVS